MQAALSKTHVGIFFLFLLFVPLQAMKKLNMKKKMALTMLREAFLLAF